MRVDGTFFQVVELHPTTFAPESCTEAKALALATTLQPLHVLCFRPEMRHGEDINEKLQIFQSCAQDTRTSEGQLGLFVDLIASARLFQ